MLFMSTCDNVIDRGHYQIPRALVDNPVRKPDDKLMNDGAGQVDARSHAESRPSMPVLLVARAFHCRVLGLAD
jgi:hypothetical protein